MSTRADNLTIFMCRLS